jgi:carbon-monoxide dehydrogenase large subunit
MAAHLLEASREDIDFQSGKFTVIGTDRSLRITEVAKAFFRTVGPTTDLGTGLDASGSASADPSSFPNGCHACEVVVDSETGEVQIDRYAVVDDVGMIINPLICEGQIHGALAQGIGQAVMEKVAFDAESGQMLSASFTDYAMPRAADVPLRYELEFVDVPAKTNPLGVKGVGEAGCVGAPPAIVLAILDALKPLGVEHIDMPATPYRVWSAIQAVRK